MAESSDQSSGFWTLTRPSKLTKRRPSDLHELHHKVFNISVVGLSGTEKDKGPIGIGKSCFCNRFIHSAADDYHPDHISVLSQSDFSGRIVNNDHWLYWGSVIKSCDGYDLAFNVIEQTEFVDDACFQPFKSGKTEPYFKRCANTKLVSAEKMMYICKNQLGVEREYEQKYLPDGKFNVDGFLCLFDVSEVHGRNIDKQIEITNHMMLNLIKTRKPIVFVTTKHDEANDLLVAEAERLVNQRDFRGLVPIVETSAQENVNVNLAFLVCAQLIDKTRAKLRVIPYFEAYKNHLDLLNAASEAYLGLIRSTVLDYRSSWQQVCIKLSHNPEFLRYTYLHGLDKAMMVFKNHLKQLRNECIKQKTSIYIKIFPDILDDLLSHQGNHPIISNNNNNNSLETAKFLDSSPQSWDVVKEQLRSHHLFNKYFIQTPAGISWYDTELLQSPDNHIPSDWLDSDEAFAIYQQRNIILETEQRRQLTREMFAQMLFNTKISVGKPFIELKHIFAGNSSLEILSDQELFEVYVEYQNNLLQQARADFQELLLENAEHLHNLTSSNKVIRQEDIKTLNAILQHDERYQALDRFDQDRTLMMIRHLSFLHSQISEQCPNHPKCVEPEIERLLITKAKTLVSKYYENKFDGKSSSSSTSVNAKGEGLQAQKTCDLVIFGPRRPSQQLILALNVLNSRAPKNSQYQITFTIFDSADEVDAQIQRFKQSNSKPKGCFGIFTNRRSLEHVSYTLEKFLLLNSQIQSDKDHLGSPPVVMLYAADITLDERTMLALENEGQQMADGFKCPFMNVTAIDQYRQHQQNTVLANEQDPSSQAISECASLDYACVDAAFNVLKEAVSRRVCFMELYNNQDLIPRQAFNPDARILMCLLCGEPFSNELFMWKAFLNYENCYVTSSKSICLKVKLDNGQEKFIEITITSYTHGAFNYREDLLHGFILVCSIERKASISILNAFSFNIPCTPVLVMAIKSDFRLGNQLNEECEEEQQALIKEAQAAAVRLKGHFELVNVCEAARNDLHNDTYSNQKIRRFLQNVIKWKPTIEKAYELGDSDLPLPASTGGGGLAHDVDFSPSSTSFSNMVQDYSKFREPTPKKYHQLQLSSDDDLNDTTNGGDGGGGGEEMERSDSSEAYSTISNSAPPKPKRFTRTERGGAGGEQITKRPLPPIPPSLEFSDSNRDVESSPATGLIKGNNRKTSGDSLVSRAPQLQASKQVSEETNESSSDVDTEDSTDNKMDKPKPGKLDLSQFDNITNAIGKLNVQPTQLKSSSTPSEAGVIAHSKIFSSQVLQESPQDTTGFFKSRNRKVKSRVKDVTPSKESKESSGNEQLASFVSINRDKSKQSDMGGGGGSRKGSNSSSITNKELEQEARFSAKESVILQQQKKGSEDDIVNRLKSKSSHFKQNDFVSVSISKVTTPTTFLQNPTSSSSSSQDPAPDTSIATNVKDNQMPKPAPRTVQSSSKTTPTVSTFAGSSGVPKRVGNPRQNHGRAVAPPQLPVSMLPDSSSATPELGQPRMPFDLAGDEEDIDFSQSPIAQRLLKNSNNHKVSELNSPYESDNEPGQPTNLFRGHKLYRGQNARTGENNLPSSVFVNSSIDSSELINSRGAAIRQLNEILANKQPPGRFGGPKVNKSSSLDQEQAQPQQQLTPLSAQEPIKKSDKDSKKDKKKLRDDEKLEKRRLKEEERLRSKEKKQAAKKSKSTTLGPGGSVGDDGIPFFIKRCIEFIEFEGLDAEGIYRVPGNRAHVDAFVQKFKENPDMSIVESDIPVNAVATALKDFLSKKWGPIIPLALMNELTELSSISDKEQRTQAVKQLVNKLPVPNYKLLKYVFSHFVKISENHSLNSMDSKNLAICWWPTLLPLHFNDMVMFEQMRPHLEESIQTMIDQYEFIFDNDEPASVIT